MQFNPRASNFGFKSSERRLVMICQPLQNCLRPSKPPPFKQSYRIYTSFRRERGAVPLLRRSSGAEELSMVGVCGGLIETLSMETHSMARSFVLLA